MELGRNDTRPCGSRRKVWQSPEALAASKPTFEEGSLQPVGAIKRVFTSANLAAWCFPRSLIMSFAFDDCDDFRKSRRGRDDFVALPIDNRTLVRTFGRPRDTVITCHRNVGICENFGSLLAPIHGPMPPFSHSRCVGCTSEVYHSAAELGIAGNFFSPSTKSPTPRCAYRSIVSVIVECRASV